MTEAGEEGSVMLSRIVDRAVALTCASFSTSDIIPWRMRVEHGGTRSARGQVPAGRGVLPGMHTLAGDGDGSSEILYRRGYPYFSSSSPALLRHSAEHVQIAIHQYRLGADSFVVEVASNDGYLLRNFVAHAIDCLGIDPADGPVAAARAAGVPTLHDFFGLRCAERLAGEGKFADVVIANNVIAHVDDINDFVAGFARLLKPTGVAVFECAYALDMIERCEFDTIYHEHLFYHTLHGLTPLFERHRLYLNDAERLPIHGGSLRVTVGRTARRSEGSPRCSRRRPRSAWIMCRSMTISPIGSGRCTLACRTAAGEKGRRQADRLLWRRGQGRDIGQLS